MIFALTCLQRAGRALHLRSQIQWALLPSSLGAYLSAPEGHVLFQHAELLERLLEPYPDVRIVLSTSWVRSYGCVKAAKNLRPALRSRVIGATFHSRMDKQAFADALRRMQVCSDVLRRQPQDWLAIDDDFHGWPAWCLDKCVRTHKHEGISEPNVLNEFKQMSAGH